MNDVVVSVGTPSRNGSARSTFEEPRRQSKDVKYLALLLCLAAVATDFLGVSIVVPVLPFYALTFGATPDELGYMYSAFAGAQLLSTQWMSRLSDRKGRRVAFLTSFVGSVVGFFIQGIAWNVESLLAARFLAGLFSGSAPVAMAYISDVCTPQERPKWMASLSAVMAGSFFVGPAVGAGLAEFGLTVPMFVSSGVSLVGLVLAFKYLKEPVKLLGEKQVKELKRINTLDLERDSDASTDSSSSDSGDDYTVPGSGRNARVMSTPSRDDGAGTVPRFGRASSSRLGPSSVDAGGGDSVRAVRASSVVGHTSVRSDDVSVAAIRLDDDTDGGGSVTANPGAGASMSVRSGVDATDAASAPIAPEVNSVTATHGAESVRTGFGAATSLAASSRGRTSRSDAGDDDTFSAPEDDDAGRLAGRGSSNRTPFSISDRAGHALEGPPAHSTSAVDGDVRSVAATRGSRRADRGLPPLRLRTSEGHLSPVGMMRVESLGVRGAQPRRGSSRSKSSTRSAPRHKVNMLLVAGSAVVIFCNNLAFTGLQLLLPLYFEKLYGYTSLQLGYIFMATSIVLILTQTLEFNAVQKRIGLLPTAMIGGVLHAAGHFCMTIADPASTYGKTVSLVINMGVLAVMVNGMALVTPAMPSFLASQASRKDMGKTLAYGGLASSAARMLGPLILTPIYTIGPTEGFAAAGAFAGFQVLVLVVMRMWCRPTKLVRAPVTPRRHKEAKHSREEWLDKLRDKIKVILEERNYELKYRRARAAVETMIDRAIPHLAPSGDQRMQDINDLVRSLGEPPVFRKVPCTPPAFA